MSGYALTFELRRSEDRTSWEAPPAELGRLLTIPEITDIRRKYAPGDVSEGNPFNHSYLTSSREYFGKSRGGVPLSVFRHGSGPSQAELDDDNGAFARLLDGAYGDVHIVETAEMDETHGGRRTWLGVRDALANPLVCAMFGGEDRLAAFLKQVNFQMRADDGHGCMMGFGQFKGTHLPGIERGVTVGPLFLSQAFLRKDHQITIEATPFSLHITSLKCYAAVTGEPSVSDIAPAVSRRRIAEDETRAGWIAGGAEIDGLAPLKRFHDGLLMTDAEPFSTAMVRGWPGHAVYGFEPIGDKVTIPVDDDFDAAVRARAPDGANCYELVEVNHSVEGLPIPQGEAHRSLMSINLKQYVAVVIYGRCGIDLSRRMPTRKEYMSWPNRIALSRRMGEAWWNSRNDRSASETRSHNRPRPIIEYGKPIRFVHDDLEQDI